MLNVTVVNYRTPRDLMEFLYSAIEYQARSTPMRLIVVNVDPLPEDLKAVEVVAGSTSAHITHRTVENNCGYGRACNQGVFGIDLDSSTPPQKDEVHAFFNADVVLTPDALDGCYSALIENERWGILGPRQVDLRHRLVHAGIMGTFDRPKLRGWHERDRGQYVDAEEAVSVSGSAYFVKQECWDQLRECQDLMSTPHTSFAGAFLETPHYYEETWCSYHAQVHDWDVVYYGPITITHKWHQASPKGGWADQQMKVSRQLFREACDSHFIAHD